MAQDYATAGAVVVMDLWFLWLLEIRSPLEAGTYRPHWIKSLFIVALMLLSLVFIAEACHLKGWDPWWSREY